MDQALLLGSPLLLSLLLIGLLPRSQRARSVSKTLAPTFYLAVALHFALFANLLASEIWTNVVRSNQAIAREASGLESMLRIAEASLGTCSVEIQDSVAFYKQEVLREEFSDPRETRVETPPFPLAKLYRLLVIDPEFIPNPTMKSLFKDSLEQVRASRSERLELKASHLNKVKLAILYLFGVLTLLSIAVYHCSDRPALIFSSLLFGSCFTVTLAVVSVLDEPYRFPYLITPAAFDRIR